MSCLLLFTGHGFCDSCCHAFKLLLTNLVRLLQWFVILKSLCLQTPRRNYTGPKFTLFGRSDSSHRKLTFSMHPHVRSNLCWFRVSAKWSSPSARYLFYLSTFNCLALVATKLSLETVIFVNFCEFLVEPGTHIITIPHLLASLEIAITHTRLHPTPSLLSWQWVSSLRTCGYLPIPDSRKCSLQIVYVWCWC